MYWLKGKVIQNKGYPRAAPDSLDCILVGADRMSMWTKKGAVQFELPPNGCSFQNAVDTSPCNVNSKWLNRTAGKNARTPQKSPDKLMQCFGSSRGYGKFFWKKTKGQSIQLMTALHERKADMLTPNPRKHAIYLYRSHRLFLKDHLRA